MSDALPLPPHPTVAQYENLAEGLKQACGSGETEAVRKWAVSWGEALAGLRGIELIPEVRKRIEVEAEKTARKWHTLSQPCTLASAQLFVAREHGFQDWAKFSDHLDALCRSDSAVSKFEAAVDAIVGGDLTTLSLLLRENPELVRMRSMRAHRSTLFHYVSANGVEDFRQKTPQNIVAIAALLLDAGAEVNAESDAYGGRSTTLMLTATSCHPEDAGVQIPLLELLLQRGAALDGPDGPSTVIACLHNGRGAAAAFLAQRGARLDLEGAAGVGRLDLVKGFFDEDGTLKPDATITQMTDGFTWACEFGRTEIVGFLLDRGMDVGARLPRHHGQTGLHWAAFRGEVETVRLLLQRRSPVDVKDETYRTTPLGWALHAWSSDLKAARPGCYPEIVALLVAAGAIVEKEWLTIPRVRADPQMFAALTGSTAPRNVDGRTPDRV